MVVVFTTENTYIYQDNVLVETHANATPNVISSGERAHQLVGAGVSDGGIIYRPFNGFIRNLRLYNYAIL